MRVAGCFEYRSLWNLREFPERIQGREPASGTGVLIATRSFSSSCASEGEGVACPDSPEKRSNACKSCDLSPGDVRERRRARNALQAFRIVIVIRHIRTRSHPPCDDRHARDGPLPRRPERDAVARFVRPSFARCLFTVAAAICLARFGDRPRSASLSLTCSYCRSSLLDQFLGIRNHSFPSLDPRIADRYPLRLKSV